MKKLIAMISLGISVTLAACGGGAATVAPEATSAATQLEVSAPTDAPSEPETDTDAPVATEAPAEPAGITPNFVIVAEESEARFYIDEVLLGNDKRVEGISNAIAGEMVIDFANPQSSVVGPITVDAASFSTDSGNRNRAIREFIFQAGRPGNGVITFTPVAIDGLPSSVTLGTPFEVSITGDLTIKGTTLPATFTGTITPVEENRVEGFLSTTVVWADFGLTIPSVPSVTFVDDTVLLEFEFVAARQ